MCKKIIGEREEGEKVAREKERREREVKKERVGEYGEEIETERRL